MNMLAMNALCATMLVLGDGDAVQLSPTDGDDLQSVLRALAEAHTAPAWCAEDCATFFTVQVGGSLKRGELTLEFTGSVSGVAPAYVELLGASASLGLDALTSNGRPLPLFWSGHAYSAVLPPGDFALRGTAHPAPGPITLTLPGPAGQVRFAVTDADVLGGGRERGVRAATYQLAPSLQTAKASQAPQRLRLQVSRLFTLQRDKRFTVEVQASGATAGQVIGFPLLAGEQVEDLDPKAGHLAGEGDHRRIDWIAGSATPTLRFGGKWTADGIALKSSGGTTKETWEVQCDDPYECTFSGDAEPWVGRRGHGWEPQAGQALQVVVQQLAPRAGTQTVAQQMQVTSAPRGAALTQELRIDWQSSSGSLVTVQLPEHALVSQFLLNSRPVPLLKDAQGALQVSVPQGTSTLRAEWQLAGEGGGLLGFSALRPPLPRLSEAVGTLYHEIKPVDGRAVVWAGGLPGSPRVALWPNLGAALLLGVAVWALFARVRLPLARPRLWLPAALGFAIQWPLAVLPLVLSLAAGRWLGSQSRRRKRWMLLFELAVWGGLVLGALGCAMGTLEHAMFAPQPFSAESFVTLPGGEPTSLTWGSYVAGIPDWASLARPWAVTVPVFGVRLLWAAWAVTLALLLWHEGRLAVQQLARYWEAATRGTE